MIAAADGVALLHAILDNPDDDLVRLVYADWLDEQGRHDRANFIRGQVRDLPTFGEAQRIWPESMTRLITGDPEEDPGQQGWDWRWNRGFVEFVYCPLTQWLEHGPAIVRAHPIRNVEITDRGTNGAGASRRWWSRPDSTNSLELKWWLPDEIFDLLPYDANISLSPNVNRAYASEIEALDALSVACLAWARSS